MLLAREGEVEAPSDWKAGTRSEECSDESLGGDRQLLSGELADVTAAESLEYFSESPSLSGLKIEVLFNLYVDDYIERLSFYLIRCLKTSL